MLGLFSLYRRGSDAERRLCLGQKRQRLSIASGKIGVDHAGDNGARLCEIQCHNGRVHLVELLAAA